MHMGLPHTPRPLETPPHPLAPRSLPSGGGVLTPCPFRTAAELQAALQTSKADVSRAEVQRLIQAVGGNHGKRIAFTEFYALHSSFVNSVFDGFDVNGDGRVCIKDIVQGLFKLGIPCSTAKAEKLLKKSDAKEVLLLPFMGPQPVPRGSEANQKFVYLKLVTHFRPLQ